jgi:hypothetical protein
MLICRMYGAINRRTTSTRINWLSLLLFQNLEEMELAPDCSNSGNTLRRVICTSVQTTIKLAHDSCYKLNSLSVGTGTLNHAGRCVT